MTGRGTSDAMEPRMVPSPETGNPDEGAWRQSAGANGRARFGTGKKATSPVSRGVSPVSRGVAAIPAAALSTRAENVLKELAAELTGEHPPKGRWIPPDGLLRKLTFAQLQTARNCGPQTTAEIIGWAALQGLVIEPPRHASKSLPVMWLDLVARFSSGESTSAELAEALNRSARRNNTRIPVAFQEILLKVLTSTGK